MKSFLFCIKVSLKTFLMDGYMYQASALSFLTLLAIVPFLSIITFSLKLSGKYVWILSETTTFIYANFLPETGNILEKYLQKFSLSASQLPYFSIIFFIITTLMMINTLETTLNNIWNVHAYRSIMNKLISWSAMLILPIFIAIITAANNLINVIFQNHLLNQFFLELTAFISHIVIFTMLYKLVPNIRLKFKNALSGGILTGVLFYFLKFIFVIYVVHFANFSAIYGSFAVIPVFLTWLYFSWGVFLYGAIYIHKKSQL